MRLARPESGPSQDVEDGQPAEPRIALQQGAGREQVPGPVEVGKMGHVRVLQRVLLLWREFWRVIAEHEQRDRETVEVHAS